MLRARVLGALVGLLLLTVTSAFALVHVGVLRPLIANLNDERAEIAVFIVDQAEQGRGVERRLSALARRAQINVQLYEELPDRSRRRLRRARVQQIGTHEVLVFPGPHTPIVMQVQTHDGPRWAVLRFPVDLEQTPRRVGLWLLLLATAAILAAWAVTRWVLRPLELAGDGMARVAAGDLGHRLPVNRDITGRIGDTFNRMADQVEGLVEGQRQMMAAVSHEVRTPLARLRLHAELLRDGGADPARISALEDNITEIDDLIGELLESARLEQGAIALHLGPVDLEALAATALAAVDLGDRSVRLSVDDGLCIVADERRMLRVLTNLLSNIARYTPPDTAVSVSASETDGGAVIDVSDRGPGVSEDALERLFDPFFRAEGSRNKATGGLGLGLMLVRQIVEAHQGTISAQNRDGGGLAIQIHLPASPEG